MKRSARYVAAVVSCLALQAQTVVGTAQSQEFKCQYTRKVWCDASGCTESPVGAAYLLLPPVGSLVKDSARSVTFGDSLPTIRRCDADGCSTLTVRAHQSGAFANIAQDGGSYFVKINNVDVGLERGFGAFVEVASIGLNTLTYFGKCAAAAR